MTLEEALAELEALGNERMRKQNIEHGASGEQFGVRRGDVRKVAKQIKTDHALALALWETGNIDARFLAILVMNPKELSADQLDELVRSVRFVEVADWINSYVVKKHADVETLRQKWMAIKSPTSLPDRMAARAGWNFTSVNARKNAVGMDLSALLDRIGAEMGDAAPEVQWTMNFTLAEIGIHHVEHRERALAIGEALGVFRDVPTSMGCTSPFAPIWINAMVARQG